MSIITIKEAKKNKSYKIQTLENTTDVFERFGLYEGQKIRLISKAPFGGPYLLQSDQLNISIDEQLAYEIKLSPLT